MKTDCYSFHVPSHTYTDIKECVGVNLCNASSSTCHNTLGSYSCLCNHGYEQLNDKNCSGKSMLPVILIILMRFNWNLVWNLPDDFKETTRTWTFLDHSCSLVMWHRLLVKSINSLNDSLEHNTKSLNKMSFKYVMFSFHWYFSCLLSVKKIPNRIQYWCHWLRKLVVWARGWVILELLQVPSTNIIYLTL